MKKSKKAAVQDAPDDTQDNTGLKITCDRISPTKTRVQAADGETVFHTDQLSIDSATARTRFVNAVVHKGKKLFQGEIDAALVEQELLNSAQRMKECSAAESTEKPEYFVVDDAEHPERNGIYHRTRAGDRQLTNFDMTIECQVTTLDDDVRDTKFEGTITFRGQEYPFDLSASELADDRSLRTKVYATAGSQARILGKVSEFRDALSTRNDQTRATVTTNFGWNSDFTAYLTPDGVVDKDGFRAYREDEERVDLSREQWARWLTLQSLPPVRLRLTRKSIVADFLGLHEPTVTYSVLAAVALAPLIGFAEGKNRFSLWLRGLTGGGKSFLAKLAANFFGDFPIEMGVRLGSWTSTANMLQHQGFFFRDAIYVVDDYKPENVKPAEAIRLLQNYADGSARGRLNRDSSSKALREIRGFVLSTAEDVPEHSSSALARSIIVDLPQREKKLAKGGRCLERRPYYRGVMADFLRSTIVKKRRKVFVRRVDELHKLYYSQIAGRQNDARIAGNFALLGAAFEEIAAYLADVWPEAQGEARRFVMRILPRLRDQMVDSVQEQQPSQVFVEELCSLLACQKVRIVGLIDSPHPDGSRFAPIVGHTAPPNRSRRGEASEGDGRVVELSLSGALSEVQKSLNDQKKPPLQVSETALVAQFVAAGLLLDPQGNVIAANQRGRKTYNLQLDGGQARLARLPVSLFLGQGE
jgi:Domain of unknown function (DUF927)